MKEEFSHKMGIFIQMWSEDEEKKLKEKIEELLSTKEETEPEEDVGVFKKTTPKAEYTVKQDREVTNQ